MRMFDVVRNDGTSFFAAGVLYLTRFIIVVTCTEVFAKSVLLEAFGVAHVPPPSLEACTTCSSPEKGGGLLWTRLEGTRVS